MKVQEVKLINLTGESSDKTCKLPTSLFGELVRPEILHQVVRWQLAKRQAGTHQTKTIDMVSGTTKKPFKQKGTGNARQGSLRSPQMVGGATIHGPVTRSHAHKLPKKVRRLGLRIALSAKLEFDGLQVLTDSKIKTAKTADFAKLIKKIATGSVLVIDNEIDNNLALAVRNVPKVNVLPTAGANVYDILRHDNVLITEAALKVLEERLC